MNLKPTLQAALARPFLAVTGLALCAGVAAQTAPPLEGTLRKIKDTASITVATRGASIPFNYLDDNNKQAGFAWEISQRVAEQVKKELKLPKLEIKPLEVTPQTRIPLVANQTVDLECSSTTNNLERQNQVSFSTTFFVVGARLLVRKNSGIKHWSDLVGKNVVVSGGTTGERMLRQINEKNKWGINIMLAKDINENSHRTAGDDTGTDLGRAQQNLAGAMTAMNVVMQRTAVAQRYEDQVALGAFGGLADSFRHFACLAMTEMRSGEFASLYDKYFMKPIAVKGNVTINFPMSPDMQELVRHPSDQPL